MILTALITTGLRILIVGFLCASASDSLLRTFCRYNAEWVSLLMVALGTGFMFEMFVYAFVFIYELNVDVMSARILLLSTSMAAAIGLISSLLFVRSKSGRSSGFLRSALIAIVCVAPTALLSVVAAVLEGLF